MLSLKGLYIHIPFCKSKCRYCDFVSYTNKEDMISSYLDAMLTEADSYRGEKVDTVFVGGGTPTILSTCQLEYLFKGINNIFCIDENAEITIEANPGTVNGDKFKVLKDMGVNRISLGVQSFNDIELKALGRIHDSFLALKAVEEAGKHFENINIDIMTSIPYQTYESLMNTLSQAVKSGVCHLSCYSLIVEENTPFYELINSGKLPVGSEEDDRRMYHDMVLYLKDEGFLQYEISNFAKVGKQSRHNLKYWNTHEYIGLGAAAHSYIDSCRFYNTANIQDYIKNPLLKEDKILLTKEDKISEYIIMTLRTNMGVDLSEFKKRFSIDFLNTYQSTVNKFAEGGFLKVDSDRCFLTQKGIDVSNSIMCEFV